jgi:hypothetical protein
MVLLLLLSSIKVIFQAHGGHTCGGHDPPVHAHSERSSSSSVDASKVKLLFGSLPYSEQKNMRVFFYKELNRW